MRYIFIRKCFVRICTVIIEIPKSTYKISVYGAEGQFMTTWYDFEPEFKPRRSRKRPIKMLINRGKDWKKTKMKKKQFENATNLGEKKGKQEKIGNREKNYTSRKLEMKSWN